MVSNLRLVIARRKDMKNTAKARKPISGQNKFIFFCLLPAILMVGMFTFYPFFRGIGMAFQKYTLFDLTDIHFIGLDNFKTIFAQPQFLQALSNSFYWVFISLIFQFVIGFILALLLKKPFKGRGVYQGFVFYSWAMSGFLIGIIWRWMLNGQIGVINDLLLKVGLIEERIGFLSDPKWSLASVIVANVWYGIAFFAIMLLAALQSIPDDLYESAGIDGANWFHKLFYVTIPYIMPTIIASTLLRVIWIFNFPDIIYAMTNGGPAGSTHILATYMMDKIMFGGDYGQAAAAGVIMIILLAMYTIFYLMATKSEKGADF